MNFLFAWRYFKAKKSTNAINIIAWISVLAILVGTAALILVLSVFNGFEVLVKSLYSSFYPDLRLSPKEGKVISITPEQLRAMRGMKDIEAFCTIVEEKALLQNGEIQTIVYLKGVDEHYPRVTTVADNLLRGTFSLGDATAPSVVLGKLVAILGGGTPTATSSITRPSCPGPPASAAACRPIRCGSSFRTAARSAAGQPVGRVRRQQTGHPALHRRGRPPLGDAGHRGRDARHGGRDGEAPLTHGG